MCKQFIILIAISAGKTNAAIAIKTTLSLPAWLDSLPPSFLLHVTVLTQSTNSCSILWTTVVFREVQQF